MSLARQWTYFLDLRVYLTLPRLLEVCLVVFAIARALALSLLSFSLAAPKVVDICAYLGGFRLSMDDGRKICSYVASPVDSFES